MKVFICIGSSCHLRGSESVVRTFREMADECGVQAEVELSGSFCMGACSQGVSVKVGENIYHVRPEDADKFFEQVIVKEAKKCG